MITTHQRWTTLLVIIGLSMTLNACGKTMTTHDANTKNLPVITAQLGDTWAEVKQHSTLQVGELHFGGAGTIINEPHHFIYRDARHAMQLDNVGDTSVSMNYENTAIDSFATGVHRESAATDETWQRLQALIAKMEQAGWIPDDERNRRNPPTKSAADLRSLYINLAGGQQE